MICRVCGKDKELNTKNFYKTKSKLGFDTTCAKCRKLKSSGKSIVKTHQNTRVGFINPEHPIPLKLTTMDGFGGYWKFDIEKLKDNSYGRFVKECGLKNHMVNRKFKCWQVKNTNEVSMKLLCDHLSMSRDAIITFEKPDKTIYVVNLFHPDILKVIQCQ